MANIAKVKLNGSIFNIVDNGARELIQNLPSPMVFKGTLGSSESGATINELPTAAKANVGHTYKVITAGTYDGKTAKIGDLFICRSYTTIVEEVETENYEWVLVPSGDEPSGTVTNVAAGTGLTTSDGNPITTSGTISHATTTAVTAAAVKVGNDNLGHVVIGDALTTDDIAGVSGGGNDVWFLDCGTSTETI